MVVYEWADSQYLGKVTDPSDDYLPVCLCIVNWTFTNDIQKTYVCTSNAVSGGFCTIEQLGRFILDLPQDKPINATSFWSARVELPSNQSSSSRQSDFWDNPDGNPTPPSSKSDTPWRRHVLSRQDLTISSRQTKNPSPGGIFQYSEPIHYVVSKTGYYCVGQYPVAFIGTLKVSLIFQYSYCPCHSPASDFQSRH